MVVPQGVVYDELADNSMDIELPYAIKEISLHNAGVPGDVQTGGRQSKQGYRDHVMDLLYEGSWRVQVPFSTAFPFLKKMLRHFVLSDHQRKYPEKSAWKVRLWVELLVAWMYVQNAE